MSAPTVKGWCPGAYRPMLSGDGLVLRVRPWMGELSADQVLVLCDLAERYGTAALEVTSRANVQIRGLAERDHDTILAALLQADLLDLDPALDARRNIIVMPEWRADDETVHLAQALRAALPDLPDLPAKFGYAIDTGAQPWLAEAPADIRLERAAGGGLILVADGARAGRPVTRDTAIPALHKLVAWFVETGGRTSGRMARHLKAVPLPEAWTQVLRQTQRAPETPKPGTPKPVTRVTGRLLGVPFGQIKTAALRALVQDTALKTLRVLPGRLLLAGGSSPRRFEGFCAPDDPVLRVHACIGAPGCPQALGPTRPLARALAADILPGETLHVSGCQKGCAHPRAADRTFIATAQGFDLVRQGAPWDAPVARDLQTRDITPKAAPQG